MTFLSMEPEISQKSLIPFDPDLVRQSAENLKSIDGPLLPILHSVNDQFGYVDERALPIIADVLNLTRAEVHGVVSFYHDFQRTAPRRHIIKVCRAEACQSMGSEQLFAQIQQACTDDDTVMVESVYCLGNCCLCPAALIDGKLYGRLDAAKTLALVHK